MNSLPVQKLSITEFLVAVAVGLMLFLLPNDAKNQFESELVCEGYVFVVSFVIIAIMLTTFLFILDSSFIII